MNDEPRFDLIGALLGDKSRARILTTLMGGRSFTATELALAGGVAPSTASNHLLQLCSLGLIAQIKQGRHRYFHLADLEVAKAIESLMGLATREGLTDIKVGPRNPELRYARVCYDHLAGKVGVELYTKLLRNGIIAILDSNPIVTEAGIDWCGNFGINVHELRKSKRRLCRCCLDWSERKMHLAGGLGAAILTRLLSGGYVRRAASGRAVMITRKGKLFFESPENPLLAQN